MRYVELTLVSCSADGELCIELQGIDSARYTTLSTVSNLEGEKKRK
jgi:hypothetical protein